MDDVAAARPRLLVALLAVLLLVVLGFAAVLYDDRRDAAGIEAQRPADIGSPGWDADSAGRAVTAARVAARTYFTLDHRRIEAGLDAMRALGTPAFVEEYDAGARALTRRIVADRLRLSAVLPRDGTATEYLVTDRARVLVSVEVATRRGDAQRTTSYRTRVALDLVEGDWLVSSLDEVA